MAKARIKKAAEKRSLYTVVMRGFKPGETDRVLGTWKVVAASEREAAGIVDARFVKPYMRGSGLLAVTGAEDPPTLPADGSRLVKNFADGKKAGDDWTAYTTDGKVWRWASNDRCPFDDCCAEMGIPVDFEAMKVARDADTDKSLASYRAAMANRPPEAVEAERAEARAAHGPGKKMVNVVTGETWTT